MESSKTTDKGKRPGASAGSAAAPPRSGAKHAKRAKGRDQANKRREAERRPAPVATGPGSLSQPKKAEKRSSDARDRILRTAAVKYRLFRSVVADFAQAQGVPQVAKDVVTAFERAFRRRDQKPAVLAKMSADELAEATRKISQVGALLQGLVAFARFWRQPINWPGAEGDVPSFVTAVDAMHDGWRRKGKRHIFAAIYKTDNDFQLALRVWLDQPQRRVTEAELRAVHVNDAQPARVGAPTDFVVAPAAKVRPEVKAVSRPLWVSDIRTTSVADLPSGRRIADTSRVPARVNRDAGREARGEGPASKPVLMFGSLPVRSAPNKPLPPLPKEVAKEPRWQVVKALPKKVQEAKDRRVAAEPKPVVRDWSRIRAAGEQAEADHLALVELAGDVGPAQLSEAKLAYMRAALARSKLEKPPPTDREFLDWAGATSGKKFSETERVLAATAAIAAHAKGKGRRSQLNGTHGEATNEDDMPVTYQRAIALASHWSWHLERNSLTQDKLALDWEDRALKGDDLWIIEAHPTLRVLGRDLRLWRDVMAAVERTIRDGRNEDMNACLEWVMEAFIARLRWQARLADRPPLLGGGPGSMVTMSYLDYTACLHVANFKLAQLNGSHGEVTSEDDHPGEASTSAAAARRPLICFVCKQAGHKAESCPARMRKAGTGKRGGKRNPSQAVQAALGADQARIMGQVDALRARIDDLTAKDAAVPSVGEPGVGAPVVGVPLVDVGGAASVAAPPTGLPAYRPFEGPDAGDQLGVDDVERVYRLWCSGRDPRQVGRAQSAELREELHTRFDGRSLTPSASTYYRHIVAAHGLDMKGTQVSLTDDAVCSDLKPFLQGGAVWLTWDARVGEMMSLAGEPERRFPWRALMVALAAVGALVAVICLGYEPWVAALAAALGALAVLVVYCMQPARVVAYERHSVQLCAGGVADGPGEHRHHAKRAHDPLPPEVWRRVEWSIAQLDQYGDLMGAPGTDVFEVPAYALASTYNPSHSLEPEADFDRMELVCRGTAFNIPASRLTNYVDQTMLVCRALYMAWSQRHRALKSRVSFYRGPLLGLALGRRSLGTGLVSSAYRWSSPIRVSSGSSASLTSVVSRLAFSPRPMWRWVGAVWAALKFRLRAGRAQPRPVDQALQVDWVGTTDV